MEHAPRRGIERIAAMHDTAVVPHHHVAGAPLVVPGELRLRGVRPQLVEQRLRFPEGRPTT
jgi:hypothetical protein